MSHLPEFVPSKSSLDDKWFDEKIQASVTASLSVVHCHLAEMEKNATVVGDAIRLDSKNEYLYSISGTSSFKSIIDAYFENFFVQEEHGCGFGVHIFLSKKKT